MNKYDLVNHIGNLAVKVTVEVAVKKLCVELINCQPQ